MQKMIMDNQTKQYIGLDSYAYKTQPIHESTFKYPIEIEFYHEPQNIFEGLIRVFDMLKTKTSYIRC